MRPEHGLPHLIPTKLGLAHGRQRRLHFRRVHGQARGPQYTSSRTCLLSRSLRTTFFCSKRGPDTYHSL